MAQQVAAGEGGGGDVWEWQREGMGGLEGRNKKRGIGEGLKGEEREGGYGGMETEG